ncbi:MAG: LCP family protein, partial [Oscillospiraceae bacterium]
AVDYFLGDMTYNDITDNHSDLGINDEVADKLGIGHIKNIAMFGIDSRNPKSTKGRSDTIIILSVNTKNNSIKMTSILRDSYVAIDGHGKEKITHAYAYGGPVLAIKTINQNFHLNIKDYVSVNFAQLSAVLDVMDGIDLEITEAERRELNRIMESENFTSTPVAKSGMVHLNGIQAMHFARIRKIDGDDARAERQGKVLNCLFEKVKTMSASKYPALLKTIMPNVETSLSYSDIIGYAPMMAKGDLKLERSLVPDTKLDKPIGGNYDGAWVWRYDLNAASNRMHEWIYGDEIEK